MEFSRESDGKMNVKGKEQGISLLCSLSSLVLLAIAF